MSWDCNNCNEPHPDRFGFCPVNGTVRPKSDENERKKPIGTPNLVLFEKPKEATSSEIIKILETALLVAREGHVTFASIIYGRKDNNTISINYRTGNLGSDIHSLITSCFGLAQLLVFKHFRQE
jgi:hypothetical protein